MKSAKGGDTRAKAAANGKRVGRPPKPKIESVQDRTAAGRVIAGLELSSSAPPTWESLPPEIRTWAPHWHSPTQGLDCKKYLYDKRDGKAVHTVNHLHDKPLEMTVTHTLSERFRLAMEKAEKRVSGR